MNNSNTKDKKTKKNPLKKVGATLAGTIVSISIYSGAITNSFSYALENNSDYKLGRTKKSIENTIEYSETIPECYYEDIKKSCNTNTPTEEDLENVKTIWLHINDTDQESLEFLKKCKNLETINIIFTGENYSCLNTLPYIESLKNIGIRNDYTTGIILENDPLLDSLKDIDNLTVVGFSLGPNTIEKLTNLKKLTIQLVHNFDINFEELNINELDLTLENPYDLAISFTEDDYKKVLEKGINVVFKSEEQKEEYLNICNKLNSIINELNIDQNDKDKEKFNKILCYVLENLDYDEEISKAVNNKKKEEIKQEKNFYKDGLLYGALETETSICGNYAALVKALMNRVGLKAYYLANECHAWNLIQIEGITYCVDATSLDSKESKDIYGNPLDSVEYIKKGNGDVLRWYMENPSNKKMDKLDPTGKYHYEVFPDYMQDEKINLKIDNYLVEGFTIGGLLGLLGALGINLTLKKKNKNQKR